MPSVKHYWTKKPLYHHPIFGKTMSRTRFEHILRCTCYYDVNDHAVQKFEKIKWLIDFCNKNLKKCYSPPKHLSIDEALLLFKGRLLFKQYISNKRSRFGLKLYEIASSTFHYMLVKVHSLDRRMRAMLMPSL